MGFLTETIWISWQNIKDFSVNLFGFLTVEWGAPPCQSNLLRIFSKSIQWLKRGLKAPASGPHLGFWLTSTAQHQNLKMERLMKKTSSKATISSKESPELQKMLISVVQQIPAEDGAHEEHSPFVPEQGGVRGPGWFLIKERLTVEAMEEEGRSTSLWFLTLFEYIIFELLNSCFIALYMFK